VKIKTHTPRYRMTSISWDDMGIYAKMRNWMVSEDPIWAHPLTQEEIIKTMLMKIHTLLSDIFLDTREQKDISFLPQDLTLHYKKELWDIALDAVYIATKYSEIEEKITRYKYFSERENVDLFVDLFGKIVDQYGINTEEKIVLVPVPMHWSRYVSRWFNHTILLVTRLSKNIKIPHQKLLWTKWTRHQSKLTREKRLENKANTIRMNYHTHIPHTVVLIDDVISTGSTANECAKVLKNAGVQRVIGIFIASNI
jgi:ComF family protein